MGKNGITLRAFVLGMILAAVFAVLTVYAENLYTIGVTSTQIPVLPYLLLIITVLLINPLCRLIRVVRAFSPVEMVVIFIMGMVSAGLSTYGLTSQLVPIAGSLFNSEWNNKQSEWNRYVVPYLNESYFISEPGIQKAASAYRADLTSLLEKKNIYESAGRVRDNAKLVAAIEKELAGVAETDSVKIAGKKTLLENTRRLQADSLREWRDLRGRHPHLPEWQEVLPRLPPEIDAAESLVQASEKRLLALEEPAFSKVAVFRRGLPRNECALPSILPAGDDLRSYFRRLRRLLSGMDALSQMKRAWRSARALPSDQVVGPELTAFYGGHFVRATKILLALNNRPELKSIKEDLLRQQEEFAAQRVEQVARLRAVSEEKRSAGRQRVLELNSKSDEIIGETKRIEKQYKGFQVKQELFRREVDCVDKIQTLVDGINELQIQVAAGNMRAGELANKISTLMPVFASIDVSLRRYFLGQIPWSVWIKPFSHWALLIGLTYIVLMSLNVLIFRQWAHNERLIYPLAELSKTLIGEAGTSGLPPVFRGGLFWAGVAISASVLGWNLLCSTQIIPGLVPLNLENPWLEYVNKTQFDAFRNMRAEIFFTMIGLAFLVPKNITFSLWFFYLIYMVQLLIMVWTGYGQNDRSFPMDWWYQTNFRNAQGQGALIIFSGFILYKCRKYILCALFPSSVAGLDEAERKELKLSSIAFLGCSLGLILLLWLFMGANLYYTILFYVIILVITIGLVRVVAEGGLLSFQAWANPIHYVRNFFGLDRSWTSASLFAPLMIYYSVIFLDIKTFIAPAMANALKLREDYRLKRFSFHVAVASAIVLAAVVAVGAALMMCYGRGADTMESWFYTQLPRDDLFKVIRTLIKDAPAATTGNIAWTVSGGLTMTALLFFRQFYFWLPHPIGLIMFVNPIMNAHWFSIFLGWICNVAVTKYGNKNSFQRAKGFFIGLIMGNLILVVVSFIVTATLGTQSGIDLNRQ